MTLVEMDRSYSPIELPVAAWPRATLRLSLSAMLKVGKGDISHRASSKSLHRL